MAHEEVHKKIEEIQQQVARLQEIVMSDTVIGRPSEKGIGAEILGIVHEEKYLFESGDVDVNSEEVKKLHAEIRRLKRFAFRDELTEVVNRRGFFDKYVPLFNDALYQKQHADSKRKPLLEGFAVIFLDADNFKSVNDTHGHDEGDQVLKAIADVLKDEVRETDAVARFGGEEFVAVLLNADEESAARKADKIREEITKRVKVSKDDAWKITASVGVAALSHSDADTLDELIGYADQAMYEAKTNRGKDTVVRHSEITK